MAGGKRGERERRGQSGKSQVDERIGERRGKMEFG